MYNIIHEMYIYIYVCIIVYIYIHIVEYIIHNMGSAWTVSKKVVRP